MSNPLWESMVKRPPPLWATMVKGIEVWLPDMATLVAVLPVAPGGVPSAPTDHGTPQDDEERYGPFRARIGWPVRNEQHQPDREVLQHHYQLSIESDRPPKESQSIEVRVGGDGRDRGVRSGLYHVQGTVNPRPSPWGQTLLYNVEVLLDEEY